MMPSSSSDSEDDLPRQAPTAGMMPPSDSEEDEDEDGGAAAAAKVSKGKAPAAEDAEAAAAGTPQLTRKEQKALAADMERLALVRQRREAERQARIKEEGWDRFAPVSETNKPPVGAPPAKKKDDEDEDDSDDDDVESDDE